jgi:hypothetical protein
VKPETTTITNEKSSQHDFKAILFLAGPHQFSTYSRLSTFWTPAFGVALLRFLKKCPASKTEY